MGYSGQSCEERTKELDFQQHLRCCVVVVAAVTRRLFGEHVCMCVGGMGGGAHVVLSVGVCVGLDDEGG